DRSTIDQILKLQDLIQKNNRSKGYTLGVFIDFEKAYDLLSRKGLISKLKKLGVSGKMFAFINDFIQDRTIEVRVGKTKSKVMRLENGTPQGSVISPILFLVMINDLKVSKSELSLFADDSSTFKTGRNLKLINKGIQTSLDQIQTWCDTWGFKISVAKTCAVLFTHKSKTELPFPLTLNGQAIKTENKVKFLGVWFDSRLQWNVHVDYIVTKCKKRLNLMRSLTGMHWGASK